MRGHHLMGKPMAVLLIVLWLGGCATASVSTESPKHPTVSPPAATGGSNAPVVQPHVAMAPADIEK